MTFFTNLKPLNKSMFIEYPSVISTVGVERDDDGEIFINLGRLHAVISPAYG